MWKFLIITIIALNLFHCCNGYSGGAPDSRCGTMVPGHWVSPQTTPSPFHILLSSDSVQEGDSLTINLTSSKNQQGFKGFLIQVKRPGEQDAKNFGTFDTIGSDNFQSQPVNCFGHENSAMTHKDPVEKHFVNLVWIAPIVENGDDGVYEGNVCTKFLDNLAESNAREVDTSNEKKTRHDDSN
ncbi:putative defense protein Hdd11 isoform X2 [Folsomia candida]|uniref:putative defense protein Hdd11 isoform X2 n=1 Tax=Folsomia candida TaxID=158441 RepID=UPI0016050CDB|nr:putative defense protein Hdd11 isoform X2 [Folsomia candida]